MKITKSTISLSVLPVFALQQREFVMTNDAGVREAF